MISVVIDLVKAPKQWQIMHCVITLADGRLRPLLCPTRKYSSRDSAINAMKRRVMEYVRQKGCTDSPLDIDWHIAVGSSGVHSTRVVSVIKEGHVQPKG